MSESFEGRPFAEIAGMTESEELQIAIDAVASINKEYGFTVDPAYAADRVAERTGIHIHAALLAAFSQ